MENSRYTHIPLKLDDNTIVKFESSDSSREKDISNQRAIIEYEKFSLIIEKVARQTLEPLKKINAKKITLKMGVSLGVESGGITALIVKGIGNANIEVTIEWESDKK